VELSCLLSGKAKLYGGIFLLMAIEQIAGHYYQMGGTSVKDCWIEDGWLANYSKYGEPK